ncbi:low temperature requirement protein A [Micromonospora polyrhachis]|uniref:Low temperature requirement protein LtrA n=1 Tax=Micromonospora polyrhachis TaxID=1282883 RepID=A0A7W7SZM7_9ACTN|nr:low temperature requirement protein A [Micromonospora polyrhachis]MBB4962565.1 low temperature requirement protein LtrA [Micromonospora polyrhachis]
MRTGIEAEFGSPEEAARRPTFLELFFDLVFVFALTRIVARIDEGLTVHPGGNELWDVTLGFFKAVVLLLALFAVWEGTAWTTTRYNPDSAVVQIVVVIALVCSMVMGVAMPRAFSSSGLAFAIAFCIAQISRPLLLRIALRQRDRRALKLRMLITHSALAVLWISGALVIGWPRGLLWGTALVAEYVLIRFGWPVPGLARADLSRWDVAGGHLAERFQQFFLIALGETILVIGFTYSQGSFDSGRTTAFALAIATSLLIWWIYFHRAGKILAEAVAASTHPATIGRSVANTHILMTIGIVATAAGYEISIDHAFDYPKASWLIPILGGPVLFIAARSRLEYEVFSRVSPSRIVTIVALLALAPVVLFAPTLVASAVAAVVLGVAAVVDLRRSRGAPPEAAVPPF